VNLPNLLTLSRIPIIFGVVALLYLPMTGASTAAFVLFVIGAITDWADGYFARKQGIVSNFGKLMDALTDKVFMVGLFITLVVLGELPGLWSLFLLLLILSREFLIIVSAILLLLAISIRQDFPILFPEIAGYSFDEILHRLGVVFFVLAAVLTVSSGAKYMTKYWSVFIGEGEAHGE
jgi:CDP-diacylglycerol--glycerol-3-phosphate 3-phosphatidyltransferase